MDFFKEKGRRAQIKLEKDLKKLEEKIRDLQQERKRIIDIYASGNLSRPEYIKRCLNYDRETLAVMAKRANLLERVPLLHKTSVIDASINQYCESVRTRLLSCTDFESKRQFLLDHIEKVTYWNDRIALHGSIPVSSQDKDSESVSNMEFCVVGTF